MNPPVNPAPKHGAERKARRAEAHRENARDKGRWSLRQETSHKEGADGDNAHGLAVLNDEPSLTRPEPDNVVDSTGPCLALVAKAEKDRARFEDHKEGG